MTRTPMTVVEHFDEAVVIRPPAGDPRPEFSAWLHAHAVDDAGDWWAQVTPELCSESVGAPEWVPVWWVFRAELSDDDGWAVLGVVVRLRP